MKFGELRIFTDLPYIKVYKFGEDCGLHLNLLVPPCGEAPKFLETGLIGPIVLA
jgi:hypothetical protein